MNKKDEEMKSGEAKGETLYCTERKDGEDMSGYAFEDYQIVKKIG